MRTLQERILLFRIQKLRDERAFGELYDLYKKRIARFVALKVSDSNTVDELVSDVFVKAWKYLLEDEPVSYPQALLFRIARTTVADYYRARNTDYVGLSEDVEDAVQSELPEKTDAKLEEKLVRDMLNLLHESYREALVLRYFEQMSVAEIAEALDKTPGTVRVLLHRAEKALQEKMKTRPLL